MSIVSLDDKQFEIELEKVANRMYRDKIVSKLGKRQMKNAIRDLRKMGDVDEDAIRDAMNTLTKRSGVAKRSVDPIRKLMYELFIEDEPQAQGAKGEQIETDEDESYRNTLRIGVIGVNDEIASRLEAVFNTALDSIRAELEIALDIVPLLEKYVPLDNEPSWSSKLKRELQV